MIRFLLSALAMALLSVTATANDVYRTVDRDGTVIYSDRPLSANSRRVSVASRDTDPERVAAELEALQEEDAARRQRSAEPAGLAAARAEQEELKAAACREAREKAEAYERSPRVYEQMPDGSRRYLSDEDVARARLAARQAVTDFCD